MMMMMMMMVMMAMIMMMMMMMTMIMMMMNSLSRCGFCSVPLTVIAKTEELEEDMRYIGQMAGVNLTSKTVKNPSSGGTSSLELTRKYFSRLDEKAVRELERVYRLDFEMFQYSPEGYY